MKILFAADLHGQSEEAQQLIERFVLEGADRLVLLGDLLGYNRFSMTSKYLAARLAALAPYTVAVRGNNDFSSDERVLGFSLPTVRTENFGGVRVYLSHYPTGDIGGVDLIAHGHTHIPELRLCDGSVRLCPGSVGAPRGGSAAGYATMENGKITLKRLDGMPYDSLQLPLREL